MGAGRPDKTNKHSPEALQYVKVTSALFRLALFLALKLFFALKRDFSPLKCYRAEAACRQEALHVISVSVQKTVFLLAILPAQNCMQCTVKIVCFVINTVKHSVIACP